MANRCAGMEQQLRDNALAALRAEVDLLDQQAHATLQRRRSDGCPPPATGSDTPAQS